MAMLCAQARADLKSVMSSSSSGLTALSKAPCDLRWASRFSYPASKAGALSRRPEPPPDVCTTLFRLCQLLHTRHLDLELSVCWMCLFDVCML